jgi:hypothetical protein
MNEQKIHKVTILLSDKYWNEELQHYLIGGLSDDGKVIVSKNKEITVELINPWMVIGGLQSGDMLSVTITC